MPYPSTVSSFTNPQPTDRLNSPSHSSVETAQNSGLTQIQTFVGTLASTAGTLIYDIRAAASDGGGHVQGVNKGGTNQTTYVKGDILVAQSSSVLTKLAVGSTTGAVLQVNSAAATGVSWSTGVLIPINVQSFVSSGLSTWVKPSIAGTKAFIQIWGGGGSGATGNNGGGGGGGGGGYNEVWLATSVLSATEQVWVGAGAASVAAGSVAGLPGGPTIFGTSSLVVVYGGGGGGRGVGGGSPASGGGGGGGSFGSVGGTGTNATQAAGGGGGAGGPPQGTNLGAGGAAPGGVGSPNAFGGGGGGGGTAAGSNGGAGGMSAWGGGGGAAGARSGNSPGGDSLYGGGGGGSGGDTGGAGGVSRFGGNGGNGASNGASPGSVPGGGGGGNDSGPSGAGAGGRAIITLF